MPVTLSCQRCANPFRVDPRLQNKARFCSRACKNASQRMPEATRICGHCGKKFALRPLSQVRNRQRYCSRACGQAVSAPKRRGMGLRLFWNKVEQCEHGYDCPYCCWPFKGSLSRNGYGKVCIGNGDTRSASRVAWELHNKRKMPHELFGAHYCHFRACANYMHIHAATQKENMADSVRDRRHYHGQRHHNSKLTKGTIKEAFMLRAQGWIIQRIADHLDVSYIVIQKLLKGDTWKYIDLDTP
jgi:hypothetical protein